jgi:hypothetical protein
MMSTYLEPRHVPARNQKEREVATFIRSIVSIAFILFPYKQSLILNEELTSAWQRATEHQASSQWKESRERVQFEGIIG